MLFGVGKRETEGRDSLVVIQIEEVCNGGGVGNELGPVDGGGGGDPGVAGVQHLPRVSKSTVN